MQSWQPCPLPPWPLQRCVRLATCLGFGLPGQPAFPASQVQPLPRAPCPGPLTAHAALACGAIEARTKAKGQMMLALCLKAGLLSRPDIPGLHMQAPHSLMGLTGVQLRWCVNEAVLCWLGRLNTVHMYLGTPGLHLACPRSSRVGRAAAAKVSSMLYHTLQLCTVYALTAGHQGRPAYRAWAIAFAICTGPAQSSSAGPST